jgi:cysteine-rich repeat protein
MPALGTTEVWRFVNRSGHIHPMHMHLVFFQVLDRQPFEIVGDTINPLGSPLPPEPHETGPKDTVLVGPNEIVRVIARFEDFVGRFAYHCHVLEHEDHEMMRQFLTTTTCGDGARGLPDEECDDGNTLDGDGCSATCALESGVDSGPMPDGGSPDGSSPDGSSPDGGDGGAEPGPNDGGCGCRVPRRGGSGLAPWWAFSAVALFLSLLRRTSRRRRRKLSIAGRSVQ